jgi:membrane protease YdiL (CAAX protease family)
VPDAIASPADLDQSSRWQRWVGSWQLVWFALAIGAALVGLTLRVPRGGSAFYVAGYALAAVWIVATSVGGSLRLRGAAPRLIDLAIGAGIGVAAFGVFVGAAEIGRRISALQGPLDSVLARADAGPLAAVLTLALMNGVAEELFFRGLVVDRAHHWSPRGRAAVAIVLYVAVTAVAGNVALTLASVVMGVVFAITRLWRDGLAAPIAVHVVWSTLMLLALPR